MLKNASEVWKKKFLRIRTVERVKRETWINSAGQITTYRCARHLFAMHPVDDSTIKGDLLVLEWYRNSGKWKSHSLSITVMLASRWCCDRLLLWSACDRSSCYRWGLFKFPFGNLIYSRGQDIVNSIALKLRCSGIWFISGPGKCKSVNRRRLLQERR